MEDSYSRLIKVMQYQGTKYNPPSMEIGLVVSDEPLIIKIGDLQLTKQNLLVADFLLPNYERKINIPITNAEGTAGDHNVSSIGISDGIVKFKDGLKKNDLIACLALEDRQKFIIFARVM